MNHIYFLESLFIILLGALAWNKLFTKVIVFEYEKGLMFENGRFLRIVEAGAYWIRRTNMQLTKVDVRPRILAINGQEVLTNDGVSLKISVSAEYKVIDAKAAILNSDSYYAALYNQMQLALRQVISGMSIDQLFESRANIGAELLALCGERAKDIGTELNSAAVKDIMLTGELKKAFGQVMKARKEGQAALERARGESAALRNLANAAKIMENNPALLQLRALQAVSESGGNTIVLGMPPNVMPLPAKAGQRSPGETTSGEGSGTPD